MRRRISQAEARRTQKELAAAESNLSRLKCSVRFGGTHILTSPPEEMTRGALAAAMLLGFIVTARLEGSKLCFYATRA